MSVVGAVNQRDNKPAYVRFEIRALEDKPASAKAGHYVAKDVDFVSITPPYSKDELHFKVDKWLQQNEDHVRNNRMPREWADKYKQAYKAWKEGQEIPLDGTPIKGWCVISPAQQETLIRMNIRTVEDLAGMNDEGARQVGMGAIALKNKAAAWLAQARDKGPATMEIANLKQQNATMEGTIETLSKQVEELKRLVKLQGEVQSERSNTITADDIMDDEKPKRGKR